MTPPDHVAAPLKTLLREWGHPYMVQLAFFEQAFAEDNVMIEA